MSTLSRSRVLGFGLVGLVLDTIASHPAIATDRVSLFKVVTDREEIVIGVSGKELARFEGGDARGIAKALKEEGSLSAWRYTLRRTGAGDLAHAPSGRIGLLADASTRIEPFVPATQVVPLDEWR